jgi:septal ring factor EnvC (AmiA/AmiB activator)
MVIKVGEKIMSKMPKVDNKPKYNNNDPFRWVDSQWEKFMTEQKEYKNMSKQLQEDLGTCTKNYSRLWDKYKKLEMENKSLREDIIDLEDDIDSLKQRG